MWPWKRSVSNYEVLERLESLERRFKTLMADVDEYFQLVRRAENRIKEKRAKLEAEPIVENGAEDVAGATSSTTPAPHARLTPHQLQIQAQILKRRGGL